MSATDGQITIFLLDDHEIVRPGRRDLFEAEDDFVVVGESGSAVEAMSRIPRAASQCRGTRRKAS